MSKTRKPVLLTAEQAAAHVGLSVCQFRVYIRNGDVKAKKYGRAYLIEKSALKGITRQRRLKDDTR